MLAVKYLKPDRCSSIYLHDYDHPPTRSFKWRRHSLLKLNGSSIHSILIPTIFPQLTSAIGIDFQCPPLSWMMIPWLCLVRMIRAVRSSTSWTMHVCHGLQWSVRGGSSRRTAVILTIPWLSLLCQSFHWWLGRFSACFTRSMIYLEVRTPYIKSIIICID